MKRRAKAIIFFISVLAAMMFAAMSVNAEVIRDDKKPATIIFSSLSYFTSTLYLSLAGAV